MNNFNSFKLEKEVELGGSSSKLKLRQSGDESSLPSSRERAHVHLKAHGRRLQHHTARLILRQRLDSEGYFDFTLEAIRFYGRVMHGMVLMTVLSLLATVVRASAVACAPYVVTTILNFIINYADFQGSMNKENITSWLLLYTITFVGLVVVEFILHSYEEQRYSHRMQHAVYKYRTAAEQKGYDVDAILGDGVRSSKHTIFNLIPVIVGDITCTLFSCCVIASISPKTFAIYLGLLVLVQVLFIIDDCYITAQTNAVFEAERDSTQSREQHDAVLIRAIEQSSILNAVIESFGLLLLTMVPMVVTYFSLHEVANGTIVNISAAYLVVYSIFGGFTFKMTHDHLKSVIEDRNFVYDVMAFCKELGIATSAFRHRDTALGNENAQPTSKSFKETFDALVVDPMHHPWGVVLLLIAGSVITAGAIFISTITYSAGYLSCAVVPVACTSVPDIGILSIVEVAQVLDWSKGCRFADSQAQILDKCVVAMNNETSNSNSSWISSADNQTYYVETVEQLLREGPSSSARIVASYSAWNQVGFSIFCGRKVC